MSVELIYTDGACSGNGTDKATGGFGIFIAKSDVFSGSTKINKKGERMTYTIGGKTETANVTNIRMEGLAIVSTLALYANALITDADEKSILTRLNEGVSFDIEGLKVCYGPNELNAQHPTAKATIEIVTDSLFWINVIESWMPGWIRKGIVMEKKNPDILLMFRYYTELLKQNCINVVYTHVRSHQKGKRTEHADGNDVADVLATNAVKNPSAKFFTQ